MYSYTVTWSRGRPTGTSHKLPEFTSSSGPTTIKHGRKILRLKWSPRALSSTISGKVTTSWNAAQPPCIGNIYRHRKNVCPVSTNNKCMKSMKQNSMKQNCKNHKFCNFWLFDTTQSTHFVCVAYSTYGNITQTKSMYENITLHYSGCRCAIW